MDIPRDFLLGTATSAYQIEGAAADDGKGASIWDVFTQQPGTTADGSDGTIACDHYHRMEADVDLIADLGVDAYRFSVSWPRVIPDGRGRVNPKGIGFYDRLVDRLLERGIEPWVTLYHWDLPYALEREGGWASRKVTSAFAEYARVLVDALGDRVHNWMPLNEPISVVGAGYLSGDHAPGRRNLRAAMRATHFQLLAHARAAEVLHAAGREHRVGIANALSPVEPLRSVDTRVANRIASVLNGLFLDPLYFGTYPAAVAPLLRLGSSVVRRRDMERINTPPDFVGVNHYSRYIAKRTLLPFYGFRFVKPVYDNVLFTDFPWEVYPDGMRLALDWVRERYGNPPVYVTENGAAFNDQPTNGRVHDTGRVSYLSAYLNRALEARADGADVRGLFVWSLMDNFEWAFGFTKRFGLVHVDFRTLERTVKESGHWYAAVNEERRLRDPELVRPPGTTFPTMTPGTERA